VNFGTINFFFGMIGIVDPMSIAWEAGGADDRVQDKRVAAVSAFLTAGCSGQEG
jgi:hypothetical protein